MSESTKCRGCGCQLASPDLICYACEIKELRAQVKVREKAIVIALTNIEGDPSYPETERILREALNG